MFRLVASASAMALMTMAPASSSPALGVMSAMGTEDDQRLGLVPDTGVPKFSVAAPSSIVSSTLAREPRFVVSDGSMSASGSQDASPTDTETPSITPMPFIDTFAPEVPETMPLTLTPEASTTAPTLAPTLTPEVPEPMPLTLTPDESTTAPTLAPTLAPVIDFSSSSTGSGSGGTGDDIMFPPASVMPPTDSSISGSGFGSGSTAGNGDNDVGAGSDGDAGVAPRPTTPAMPMPTPTAAPVPSSVPVTPVPTSLTPEASEEAARAANSRVARTVSGDSDTSFYLLATGVGGIGCVAVIVIAVYMRRRNETDIDETRTVAASSIDRRGSTQSVYDDPLGTRFSSIVMITPNGDGVCIL